MIDTLSMTRKLKDAGFTPQQAEAQAEVFAELVGSDLATKRDLKELEVALKRDIKDVELKISQVEANLKRDIKDIDLKITQVEANLKRDIRELELKMDKGNSDTQARLWQIGAGIVALLFGLTGVLFRLFSHA